MKNEGVEERMPFADVSSRQMVQVGIISITGGMLLWLLAYALSQFVFKGFCAPDVGVCVEANQYSSGVASVVIGAIILFGFVKLAIFRPLLVVIAATVSLWGLGSYLTSFSMPAALLISGLLYGVAFLTFTWLARIKVFWLSLLSIVVLVIVIRLILSTS